MNRTQRIADRRGRLADATKAQEVGAYAFQRLQTLERGDSSIEDFQLDCRYWGKRSRTFLFPLIGDGTSETEWFEASRGNWS